MNKKISSGLIAVAFAAALMLAGTAEAGPLVAGAAGPEASPWSQAWAWLTEVWGDLMGLDSTTFELDSTTPETGAPNDYGCGIDPNGTCGG